MILSRAATLQCCDIAPAVGLPRITVVYSAMVPMPYSVIVSSNPFSNSLTLNRRFLYKDSDSFAEMLQKQGHAVPDDRPYPASPDFLHTFLIILILRRKSTQSPWRQQISFNYRENTLFHFIIRHRIFKGHRNNLVGPDGQSLMLHPHVCKIPFLLSQKNVKKDSL